MHNTDMDHIDPSWSEGRDYQVVCGLDVVYNMNERDRRLNASKNNRFLPWRNTLDEMGGDPVEQGDLCLFLDPDTNEWILEEFLGTWWFDKSKRTCGVTNKVLSAESRAKMSESQRGRTHSAETRAKMSEFHAAQSPEQKAARAAKISKAKKGQTPTAEARAKMSEAHRGQTHSDETRAKMSLSKMGQDITAETRAKISKALKGKPKPPVSDETKAKIGKANRGRTHSAETRAKMSEAASRRQARTRLRRMAKWDSLIPNFED